MSCCTVSSEIELNDITVGSNGSKITKRSHRWVLAVVK